MFQPMAISFEMTERTRLLLQMSFLRRLAELSLRARQGEKFRHSKRTQRRPTTTAFPGLYSGCLPGFCFGQVYKGGDLELAGEMILLSWPGNTLGRPGGAGRSWQGRGVRMFLQGLLPPSTWTLISDWELVIGKMKKWILNLELLYETVYTLSFSPGSLN